MKYDNKSFQERYEAWKNGADYWKDIRGINLGGNSQVEQPTPEEQEQMNAKVQFILNEYETDKDVPEYKDGKNSVNDSINTFVYKMGPLVGRQLLRHGITSDTAYLNLMRQLAYESQYGTSNIARRQHNYGGVGYDGKGNYTAYKSDQDFVNDYVRMMVTKYKKALQANSVQGFSKALKNGGYYEDTYDHYTNQLMGMKSLAKAAYWHRKNRPEMYNYDVKFNDLVQDYDDALNSSPVMQGLPSYKHSSKQPSTINSVIPTTLLGPSEEEIKAQQYQDLKNKTFDLITTPTPLPNAISNMLHGNNYGKDAYGQKFWQRRGANLHFKGGKDKQSFIDWAQKASKYKGIQIEDDPTYDYKGWYNENPNRAYALLKDDPSAHFEDKWKTPYHPTFSDQSIYSNAKHPGGTWGVYDGRDAYYAPLFSYVRPDDRIKYLNMAEDNGVIPFMNNGSIYRLD